MGYDNDTAEYSQAAFDAFNKHVMKEEPKPKPNPYVKPLTERMKKNNNIDVYDVCLAFGLNAMSAHAVKKILVPGQRNGGKSAVQDIEEAIWSLQELLKELK